MIGLVREYEILPTCRCSNDRLLERAMAEEE